MTNTCHLCHMVYGSHTALVNHLRLDHRKVQRPAPPPEVETPAPPPRPTREPLPEPLGDLLRDLIERRMKLCGQLQRVGERLRAEIADVEAKIAALSEIERRWR